LRERERERERFSLLFVLLYDDTRRVGEGEEILKEERGRDEGM